jgi:hypothetical protein
LDQAWKQICQQVELQHFSLQATYSSLHCRYVPTLTAVAVIIAFEMAAPRLTMSRMCSVCSVGHNEATRQKLASDVNKSECQSFIDVAIADRNH